MKNKLFIFFLLLLILYIPALAHPGSLDDDGGHRYKATGEYHYHHGYSAHDHENGACPYNFDDKTNTDYNTTSGNLNNNNSSQKSYNNTDKEPDSFFIECLVVSCFFFPIPAIPIFVLSLFYDYREYIDYNNWHFFIFTFCFLFSYSFIDDSSSHNIILFFLIIIYVIYVSKCFKKASDIFKSKNIHPC